MKSEIYIEGHGIPFTLVKCPHGFSLEKICQEITDNNLKAKDIVKRNPSLKAIDFEKSDKDLVFIVKSTRRLADYEISHIKDTLTTFGKDKAHFCLVVADYFDLERVPKVLVPFM